MRTFILVVSIIIVVGLSSCGPVGYPQCSQARSQIKMVELLERQVVALESIAKDLDNKK